MAVPSSYNDLVESAEFRDHVGWVWYEREFIINKNMLDERVVLRFGSATHHAKVYVNGKLVVESLKKSYLETGLIKEDKEKYPIYVFIHKDKVTLTIDTTGVALHKRGYREKANKAFFIIKICIYY